MNDKKIKIVLTGGGTGGHIFPLVAVAKSIKDQLRQAGVMKEIEFLFIGDFRKINREIFDKEGIAAKQIFTAKIRRYFSPLNFLGIFTFPLGVVQSFWHLFWAMPDVIFSKGGYGSVPVVIAGWLYRIPILIHESDIVPGLANRIAGKFASRIAVSFAPTVYDFSAKKTVITGNPVRDSIISGNKENAKIKFKINDSLPVIFVIGGSQGAQAINNIIGKSLPQLLDKMHIIHQCGQQNMASCQTNLEELHLSEELKNRYHYFGFIGEELGDIYALADLVITRAGANTLAEIMACRKPSIIIPLASSAGNHQEKNALYFSEKGAGILLEEANLQSSLFVNLVLSTLQNKEKLADMAQNIDKIAIHNAKEIIAKGVIDLII